MTPTPRSRPIPPPHARRIPWWRSAWRVVLFFVPPAYRTVTQDNVDDHVGCVALILTCFLFAPPMVISAVQILLNPFPIPFVTLMCTLLSAIHLTAFPMLLKVTGRRILLSNYLSALLYVTSSVNSIYSGAGFWTFNCTPFPVLALVATFLDNSKNSALRCFIWTSLIGVTCVAMFVYLPDEINALPYSEIRKFSFAGNLFNLFVLATLGSLFCLTRDLKQREIVLQRDKATALSKVKTEFSANVSHEIRTPLVAIMGLGELLASDNSLSQDQQYFVKTIHSASQDLLSLVNNILTFVKTESLESTGLQLEKTRIHILDLIDETVRFLCTAKSNHVSLMTFVDDSIDTTNCYVEGDPHRIRQVLQNLLANAIKFCPQDGTGEVCISARMVESPPRFEFCVADNGIGINELSQQKLFQPFQQADASTTRKYGGSGLGLVICKQVCELMGGSISLTSLEGMGTHVTFSLPLPVLTPSPEERYPLFSRAYAKLRVGIVTKSRLLDKIIGNYIGSLGALEYKTLLPFHLTTTNCDVVIIDIPSAPELVQFSSFAPSVVGVIFLGSFRVKTPTLLWHQQNRTVPEVRFCLSDPVSKFNLIRAFASICGQKEPIMRYNSLAKALSTICEDPNEADPLLAFNSPKDLAFNSSKELTFNSPKDVHFNSSRELSYNSSTFQELAFQELSFNTNTRELSFNSAKELSFSSPKEATNHDTSPRDTQKRKCDELVYPRKRQRIEDLIPLPVPLQTSSESPPMDVSMDDAQEDKNRQIKILVAEDNIVNQEVITRQLGRMGFVPDIVANGRLALEAYKKQKYDLILMDCQMPEMDGYESASAIRRWEKEQDITPPVEIVALSASAMPEETERGIQSGMDDYLAKPIKLTKLKELVQGVVNKKNIHR